MILLSSIIIYLIHALLVFTTNVNVYPEFFFFPWLVRLGYLPYRDFFDQHGFLLYYILAPLTLDKSLTLIKLMYLLLQALNLTILLIILRKITNQAGFMIGGLIYALVSYYTSENNFWYEIPIALAFSLLYLFILVKPFKRKLLITALLASFASIIKPTAAIILIPLFYVYRSPKLIFYFLLFWVVVVLFFWYQNGLGSLIDGLFLFNRYYATYFSQHPTLFINLRFAKISLLFFLFCFIIVLLQKKLKFAISLIIFLFASSIFLLPIFATYNLAPLCIFFTTFVAYAIKVSQKWWKYSLYFLLTIYMFTLLGYTKDRFAINAVRVPYIEQESTKRIVKLIRSTQLSDKNIFVLGTQVELYFLLDKYPITYFSLITPWLTKYYSKIEQLYITELKTKKVQIVLIPQPVDNNYKEFYVLRNFIMRNYSLSTSSADIQIFTKK